MSTEEGGREKTAPQPAEGIQRRSSRESRRLCVGAELFPWREPQLRLGRFTPADRCAARGRQEAAIMAAGPARLREPRAAAVERAGALRPSRSGVSLSWARPPPRLSQGASTHFPHPTSGAVRISRARGLTPRGRLKGFWEDRVP